MDGNSITVYRLFYPKAFLGIKDRNTSVAIIDHGSFRHFGLVLDGNDGHSRETCRCSPTLLLEGHLVRETCFCFPSDDPCFVTTQICEHIVGSLQPLLVN